MVECLYTYHNPWPISLVKNFWNSHHTGILYTNYHCYSIYIKLSTVSFKYMNIWKQKKSHIHKVHTAKLQAGFNSLCTTSFDMETKTAGINLMMTHSRSTQEQNHFFYKWSNCSERVKMVKLMSGTVVFVVGFVPLKIMTYYMHVQFSVKKKKKTDIKIEWMNELINFILRG